MSSIIKRLREPSTYAGLAVLLSIAGVPGGQMVGEAVIQIGAGLAALLSVMMPEGS